MPPVHLFRSGVCAPAPSGDFPVAAAVQRHLDPVDGCRRTRLYKSLGAPALAQTTSEDQLDTHSGLPAGMGLAFDELDERQYGSIVDLVEEALFLTLSQGDA